MGSLRTTWAIILPSHQCLDATPVISGGASVYIKKKNGELGCKNKKRRFYFGETPTWSISISLGKALGHSMATFTMSDGGGMVGAGVGGGLAPASGWCSHPCVLSHSSLRERKKGGISVEVKVERSELLRRDLKTPTNNSCLLDNVPGFTRLF